MGEREIYNYLYSGGLIEDENKELCGCGDRIIIYGFRTSDDLNLLFWATLIADFWRLYINKVKIAREVK